MGLELAPAQDIVLLCCPALWGFQHPHPCSPASVFINNSTVSAPILYVSKPSALMKQASKFTDTKAPVGHVTTSAKQLGRPAFCKLT